MKFPGWQVLDLSQPIGLNNLVFQLFKSNQPLVMFATFPLMLPNKNLESQPLVSKKNIFTGKRQRRIW